MVTLFLWPVSAQVHTTEIAHKTENNTSGHVLQEAAMALESRGRGKLTPTPGPGTARLGEQDSGKLSEAGPLWAT